MNRRDRGDAAEDLARGHLEARGLHLVERNYHCRHGEIDLVMRDGTDLVFVEVRYRRDRRFGGAAASVDWHKRRKLIAAAQQYLQAKAPKANARFDVVAVEAEGCIDWIKNAFEAG